MMTKKCWNCETPLQEGGEFCSECGANNTKEYRKKHVKEINERYTARKMGKHKPKISGGYIIAILIGLVFGIIPGLIIAAFAYVGNKYQTEIWEKYWGPNKTADINSPTF